MPVDGFVGGAEIGKVRIGVKVNPFLGTVH